MWCLADAYHSQEKLNQVADQLNNRPRKTLMFETPKQVLQKSVALTGSIYSSFFKISFSI
jgi:IS30 family transposase